MEAHNTVLFASFDTSEFNDPESNYMRFKNSSDLDILNTAPATLKYTVKPRNLNTLGINFTSNGVDGFGTSIETFNIPKINFSTQKIYFVARFKDGVVPLKREPIIESTLDFLVTQNNNDTIRLFNTDDESLLLKENDLKFDLLSGGSQRSSAGSIIVEGASNSIFDQIYTYNDIQTGWVKGALGFFIHHDGRWRYEYGSNNPAIFSNNANIALSAADWTGSAIGIENWNITTGNDYIQGSSNKISEDYVKFYTNYSNISALGGGYYKGYLTCSVSAKDCRIRMYYNASGTINQNLTALSETFDIYPHSGVYDIRKKNEDNDQTSNYKSLAYQEILQNQPFLFDKLLGASVGDKDGSVENIGVKTYEKIGNFVANNTDPDYCNIKALISMFRNLDISFEDYNQQFPPSLTRLVDILSVSPSRQIQRNNQFQLNFDDKGFSSKLIFGKNKGDFLPLETTILYTGDRSKYILAYEKFSEEYKLVNTNILSATNVEYKPSDLNSFDNGYALSGYNPSWGWGLVIPDNAVGEKINDYYEFYDYDNTIDGTIINDFIDYTNSNCTFLESISSYSDLMGKDNIADNILTHNLISNCMLVDSSGYTASNFKPHYMYDSDNNAFYASTYEQHLTYQSLGYTHKPSETSNADSANSTGGNNSGSGSGY